MQQLLRLVPANAQAIESSDDFLPKSGIVREEPRDPSRALSLTIRGLRKSFGDNPVLQPLSKLAGVDIDHMEDYRIARALHAVYVEDGLDAVESTPTRMLLAP